MSDSAVDEWLELESDPGVFSLLVEDYGVHGVKVEEVYDVSQTFSTKVYGFVFLFRYELSDRRARKKARDLTDVDGYVLDNKIVNKMFFAHQIITNSCATHALLSVLLNCKDVNIGPNLTKLKDFTQELDPESKGYAIANMLELAHIHNKHARPASTIVPPVGGRKPAGLVSSAYALLPDTYHYISFVPINGSLFELDGLKEYPIDHGPWSEGESWTDLFQRMVTKRFLENQDCYFNLMALVPDPVPVISQHLEELQEEQRALMEVTTQLAQQVIESRRTVSAIDSKHQQPVADVMADPQSPSTDLLSSEPPNQTSAELDSNALPTDSALCPKSSPMDESVNDPSHSNASSQENHDSPIENHPISPLQNHPSKEHSSPCTKAEEPMDTSNDLKLQADLLKEVTKGLPSEDDELDRIADGSIEIAPDLETKLQVSVAKVVKSYRQTRSYKQKLKDELETKQRFRVEHSRRTHDYDEFVFEFVKCLAENNQLPEKLFKRPPVAPPTRTNKHKRKRGRPPKTTLLLNGSKV